MPAPSPSAVFAARRRLRTGGDGASRPFVSAVPHLVVPVPVPGPEERAAAAWRSRVDACRAEARAALRLPFSPPATWEP